MLSFKIKALLLFCFEKVIMENPSKEEALLD